MSSAVPLRHHAHVDAARRPVRIDRAQTHGSDLAGEPMDNLPSFIDAYVAVWNEPEAETRRRRIAAVWAPDGTTCYRLLDAHGYGEIESRVAGSWDRWLRDGKFVFRAVNAICHHRAVKLNFAMLAADSGKVEANGLAYLLIDQDKAVSAADRSQHHHNVAHIRWQVAPRDGGLPIAAASALLIFNDEGRIDAAYEFNEAKAA